MALAAIYEGTWDELASRADELRHYARRTVIASRNAAPLPPRPDANVEEMIRAMDAFTQSNQGLPHLPDEAFDRENLYGED